MKAGAGHIAIAAVCAVAAHILAALFLQRAAILGTERFAADVAALARRPEFASNERPEATRVVLGKAARVPFEGPGPRAALDPAAVRRPPSLGRIRTTDEARRALVRPLFVPATDEATTPISAELPGAGMPSWCDDELSLVSIAIPTKPAVRRLAASNAAAVSLSDLGTRTLVKMDPKRRARSLKLKAASAKLPIPTEWSEPARALRVPEVFVDVLEE